MQRYGFADISKNTNVLLPRKPEGEAQLVSSTQYWVLRQNKTKSFVTLDNSAGTRSWFRVSQMPTWCLWKSLVFLTSLSHYLHESLKLTGVVVGLGMTKLRYSGFTYLHCAQ